MKIMDRKMSEGDEIFISALCNSGVFEVGGSLQDALCDAGIDYTNPHQVRCLQVVAMTFIMCDCLEEDGDHIKRLPIKREIEMNHFQEDSPVDGVMTSPALQAVFDVQDKVVSFVRERFGRDAADEIDSLIDNSEARAAWAREAWRRAVEANKREKCQ